MCIFTIEYKGKMVEKVEIRQKTTKNLIPGAQRFENHENYAKHADWKPFAMIVIRFPLFGSMERRAM